ncbi:MAG: hypothetical protein AAGF74_06285 [Pseudomonadota bacterium]
MPDGPPGSERLRAPERVMCLENLGRMFPTRLSFLRVLTRRLHAAAARVDRSVWSVDAEGYGHAVYVVEAGRETYSLVAVTQALADEDRSDRVIATSWDAAFVLYDGVPDTAETRRIVASVPLQEAGRFTERDLVLSRANKSVRFFSHVVERLRNGQQPDPELLVQTGYLMRTTAVYGNGKFGIAAWERIADRPLLAGSFMAEMLAVWLIRGFTHDLAEHLGGAAIDANLKRHLGVGNATGLGMAPFLVSHPMLIHRWFSAREEALERACALPDLEGNTLEEARDLARRVAAHLTEWTVGDPAAMAEIEVLKDAWHDLSETHFEGGSASVDRRHLLAAAPGATEELVAAFLIELAGGEVDGLSAAFAADEAAKLDPTMSCAALLALAQRDWDWAVGMDWETPEAAAVFWYVSEEKLEPRLGSRVSDAGAELETPLDVARRVAALVADLPESDLSLAEFLLAHPQHRDAARRVQTAAALPFSEIRDNLIGGHVRPTDLLRAKLAMFGASKFDPKSDLWTRITLVQGAPLAGEIQSARALDWWLPSMEAR